jgi:MarR-like DNA-binding transcriptional regulator SgrR of sgrS sRNA
VHSSLLLLWQPAVGRHCKSSLKCSQCFKLLLGHKLEPTGTVDIFFFV